MFIGDYDTSEHENYSLLISDIFLSVNIVVIIELVIKNILNTVKLLVIM